MRVSHKWICELAGVDIAAEKIADLLTFSGLEVEGIETYGLNMDHIVVGEIIDKAPHPTRKTLNVVQVGTNNTTVQVVCGAANNQLEDEPRDGAALFQRGVTYVPDFLTNRMGIVNCANEQYGFVHEDPYFERHLGRSWEHSIHRTALEVLERSKREQRPTSEVANRLADELAEQPHPVFGHRGRQIIETLVKEDWASRPPCPPDPPG